MTFEPLDLQPEELLVFRADDFRILSTSGTTLNLLGIESTALLGRSFLDLLAEPDDGPLRERLQDIAQRGEGRFKFRRPYRQPSGQDVLLRIQVDCVSSAESGPQFIANLSRVSEGRLSAGAITEFLATLDEFEDEVLMFWPDSRRFFYANEAALRRIGVERGELFKLTPSDLYGGPSREELQAILQRMLDGKTRRVIGRRRVKLPDGDAIIVEHDIKYIEPEGCEPRFVAILRNVTAIAKVEEDHRQLQNSLDVLDVEVYMFWPGSYAFAYMNRKALARAGWLETGWHGKGVRDHLSASQFELFTEKCEALLRGPAKTMVFETTDASGTPLEISLHLIEPEGEDPRFLSVYRDIAARKQAEVAKANFMSTISHELRTPLTSIKGALQLIRFHLGQSVPAPVARMIEIVDKNTGRLDGLINDLLDWGKIEAGKLKYEFATFDLVRLARQAIGLNYDAARRHGAEFRLTAAPDHVFCRGDRSRILQVMNNLFSNAAKFAEGTGVVEISVGSTGTQGWFRIRDHAWASLPRRGHLCSSSSHRRICRTIGALAEPGSGLPSRSPSFRRMTARSVSKMSREEGRSFALLSPFRVRSIPP
ncbi:PAS domain S-box-containing protein [Jhaorihella thermophila]|uniref:histidine kinase n=1 Tax=Jhaorihella thermophila TaxID=488547 RepID=A0A1H5UR18_9RHOB|nr:PAS domain S-box protein [Jhaorihella thermophila]SEF77505.1 PAS domain S-box-containing protein [Jhaorihella thermophila]